MPVQRLGRYELIRHLASGGMARVYLARATGPGGFARHVVIKTIPEERRDDEMFVAMFLDEARLIGTLHHQHVAQVFEVARADDGTYFLAMEYVHGETVRSLLAAAGKRALALPLDVGLSIAAAAAAGLHHAHERRALDGTPLGIVHRDVSPSNVMVGFDGSIKLIDFGIAKATLRTTKTATGLVKGKVGYMAPEQARGYDVDRRSDVFALGVLAYELTTQTRAFHAETQFETLRRTLHAEVEPPSRRVPGYPPALEDVIMTALELDPDDRFQDAEALRIAVEQVARELGFALGPSPVVRALEALFPARPEPWLPGGAPASGDESTPVVTGSAPLIQIVPHTPTRVRLARGTETPELHGDDEPPSLIDPVDLLDLTTEPFERKLQDRAEPAFASSDARAAPVVVRPRKRRRTLQVAAVPAAPPPTTSTPPPAKDLPASPPAPARDQPASPPVLARDLQASAPLASLPLAAPPTPVPAPSASWSPHELAAPAEPLRRVVTTPRPFTVPPRLSSHQLDIVTARRRRMLVGATLATATAALVVIAFVLASKPATSPRVGRLGPPAPSKPAAPLPSPPPRPPLPAPQGPIMPGEPPLRAAADTVRLEVTTAPAGATVVLDGLRLGTTPLTVQVPAKPGAWLKVRKRKYIAVKTRVSLEHDVRWDVQLRAVRR